MRPFEHLRDTVRTMTTGFPRAYWFLWTGTFVNRLGTFVLPYLALYLTQVRGLTITQAGLVAAIYGVGASIAAPVGGALADHVGRRFTMVMALGLGGLGMIALGFVSRVELIAPATFAVALVSEMYRPGVQAAIADLIPHHDRVRAFSLLYWIINLGFAVGIAIGGMLSTVSFQLLFVGDGLTSLLFALLVWRGVPETRPAHVHAAAAAGGARAAVAGFFAPYRDVPYVLFLLLGLAAMVVFMQHTTTFPIDMAAHGITRSTFGMVLALNGAAIVLVQPFMGPVIARWDRSRTLALGATLVGLGFGINAFARHAPLYAVGVLVWTLGEIALLPVANAMVADLAPVALRGRYQGAYGLSFSLAVAIAPVVGSWVLQHLGGTALWLGCLAVAVLVALGHLALAPALRHERALRAAERAAG